MGGECQVNSFVARIHRSPQETGKSQRSVRSSTETITYVFPSPPPAPVTTTVCPWNESAIVVTMLSQEDVQVQLFVVVVVQIVFESVR